MSSRRELNSDRSSDEEADSTSNSSTSQEEPSTGASSSPETDPTRYNNRGHPFGEPALHGGQLVQNDTVDEVYDVNETRHIGTPVASDPRYFGSAIGGGISAGSPVAGGTFINNNPNDERFEVHDSEAIPTPRAQQRHDTTGAQVLQNAPHDEAISLSMAGSTVVTPVRGATLERTTGGQLHPPSSEGDESEDEEEFEGEDDMQEYRAEGYAGQKPNALEAAAPSGAPVLPNLEYNPADYAKANAKASREMQDLFKRILDYQPFVAELPAKLRPFIPDYIPAVGDLDPFVKVGRPDGRPDGLGLYVVDEPAIPQSNPAVVQLELRATNMYGSAPAAVVVDSFENAANRPEVIDRWIADIKKVHYKKALPTVNYQKPMPDIESLMQLWPAEYETFLNSSTHCPPPQIDLDIEQYIRTLCALLDIPTYNSLIDSLHVMFTIYEEFLSNQHFRHD